MSKSVVVHPILRYVNVIRRHCCICWKNFFKVLKQTLLVHFDRLKSKKHHGTLNFMQLLPIILNFCRTIYLSKFWTLFKLNFKHFTFTNYYTIWKVHIISIAKCLHSSTAFSCYCLNLSFLKILKYWFGQLYPTVIVMLFFISRERQ